MNFNARLGLAGLVWLAALMGLSAHAQAQGATLQGAHSQSVPSPANSDPQANPSPWPREEIEGAAKEEDPAKDEQTADDDLAYLDIDWSQLDVDIDALMTSNPRLKARRASGDGVAHAAAWSSTDKPNGSAVSVRQTISPFWDTRVGADMTLVRPPLTIAELLAEKAGNGGNEPQSSGTAWAAATAPGVGSIWDKTAVEARVDPGQDQGRFGTILSKQLTFSEQYSLTLQNGYTMTQGFAPLPGSANHTTYATEQSARLGITDTGTSFSAGQSLSTSDDKWLRKIGAEQKVFGGFNISASVAETALGTANKSISAGFKQSW